MLLESFARKLLGRPAQPPTESPVVPIITLASSRAAPDHSPVSAKKVIRKSDRDLRDDWTDTDRPLRAREKPAHFRPLLPVVSTEKAADHLISWANDVGFTGLFTSQEIDDLWRRANKELGLAEIRPMFVREALAERNLWLGKRRTLTPEYATVHQRTGVERAVLYRLPVISEQVEQKPAQVPDSPELMPGLARSEGGPGTVLTKKTNSSRCLPRSSMAKSRPT